jgi:VWFA-related protein
MRKVILTVVLCLSLVHSGLAQTPKPVPADQDDVVKITTNLVQVDAVVLKDGKPVKDLKQEDFEIFEDGRPQQITSFAYISNVSDQSPGKNSDGVITPTQPLRPGEARRTMALVVDDLGLSFESAVRVRNRLEKFINEQISPNDLVAVIRTGGTFGALQQFTNDRRALNQAVSQINFNHCTRTGLYVFSKPSEIALCSVDAYNQSMSALRYIVDAMGYLPGRKSLIFFSDSVPLRGQEIDFSQTGDGLPSGSTASEDENSLPGPINYAPMLQRVAEKAIRSSVVIYTVDVKGLVYTGLSAADTGSVGSVRESINKTNVLMSARSNMLISEREGAERLSRETGGFPIFNNNNMELGRILEDQSGYYLLGYRPSEETFNKSFHKIKARVKKSGMTLRTRFGFYGVSEEEVNKSKPQANDQMALALMSPFGNQDLPLDLTAFFAHRPGTGSLVRAVVNLNPKDLVFKETPEGSRVATIEFRTSLFGNNGQIVDSQNVNKTVTLSAPKFRQALRDGFSIVLETPVKKPGAYQFRVAARDVETLKTGGSGAFVSIPQINDGRLAVSGIVLQPVQGDSLNPVVKRFTQGTNARFSFVIYNAVGDGKRDPDLVLQARVFKDEKVIFTSQSTLVESGEQKDLRQLLATGTLNLSSTLEPRSYALQIIVTDNNAKNKPTVIEWTTFEIVK